MEERLSGHSITAVVSSLSSSSDSPRAECVQNPIPLLCVCQGCLFSCCMTRVSWEISCAGMVISAFDFLFSFLLAQCIVANLNPCNATEEIPSVSLRVVALGPNNFLGWNIGVCLFGWFFLISFIQARVTWKRKPSLN